MVGWAGGIQDVLGNHSRWYAVLRDPSDASGERERERERAQVLLLLVGKWSEDSKQCSILFKGRLLSS